jgi:hypothetical protein
LRWVLHLELGSAEVEWVMKEAIITYALCAVLVAIGWQAHECWRMC